MCCLLHYYRFTDGENCTSKVIVEEIDEEKKLLRFKNIEGSLLECVWYVKNKSWKRIPITDPVTGCLLRGYK